jgi:hypothetical protein
MLELVCHRRRRAREGFLRYVPQQRLHALGAPGNGGPDRSARLRQAVH